MSVTFSSVTENSENRMGHSFGSAVADFMFLAEYEKGHWKNARIQPFGTLQLSPLSACLHYGQTVFEGLKAYRQVSGEINIFRLQKHTERFQTSLRRMCMPVLEEGLFAKAVNQLVFLQRDWVSDAPGHALYIRPFMIATEPKIRASASDEYLFCIVGLPAGLYYERDLRVKVERRFVRAVEGGVGYAKCGGNYAGALYPTRLVQEEGFDQVLWTDALHHEFIEESGTMNVMFFLKGCLVTPRLNGSILDGVTRDSVLTLARSKGICVEERKISYKEIEAAIQSGEPVEAFGVGTAAFLTPIREIEIEGKNYFLQAGATSMANQLKEALDKIRRGLVPDPFSWNHIVHEDKSFPIILN